MITRSPFLNPAESHAINSRLFDHRHLGWKDNLNLVFGSGISYSHQLLPNYRELISAHNEMMRNVFPDLLEKLKKYFGAVVGEPCYFADDFSYPGFHIFGIGPHSVRPLWFHYDDVRAILEKDYPQFGVTEKSKQLTFTALLDSPPGLTAGLLYFQDEKLGNKVIKSGASRNAELEKFATFHGYALGEMNYYERPVHSVYGRNDSDVYLERVTLQGHLVQTNRGFLFFR